jgi:hypothetical protein
MNRHIRTWLASLTLPFALGLPQAAHAYTHPASPLNLADLQAVKAKIDANQEPWRYSFGDFAQRNPSSYGMRGPTAIVSRSPNVNLHLWRADMNAIWNLSLMWYFTGDNAYAQKAHDVLLAWATTNTEFSGQESMLDLGDYAPGFVGAAEILRGTWPGWTEADTTTVKAYFANVLMPGANPWGESMYGAANKGALAMLAQGLMGIFNDDAVTVDRIAYQARTLAHVGLRSSNDIGMLGDSLRDQGHAHVQLLSLTRLAEALWQQGIDIYSDHNNRLLAAGEYYARVNDLSVATPFLPFGTTDAYYQTDVTNRGFGAGATAFRILHNAYVVRKGLTAPNMARRLQEMAPDWLFMKDADASTAAPAPALTIPATTSITSGFSDAEIDGALPVGNSSYSGGIWTVQGGGWSIWGANDDGCHFTYKAVTGDCAIIAKVESVQNTHQSARAGVMLRTSLDARAPRVWMAVTPSNKIEQNIQGISVYGGSNYGNKVAAGIAQPSYWVKLERLGNMVTGYISPDGTNWAATEVGRLDNAPATWYVGLVVSSTSGSLNTSTFSNVQITGGNGGAPIVTPAAPPAFMAAAGENAVSLRWQSSFGATGYTIKRATSSGGTYSTIASGVTGSSYTDTTATNGTTYYYVVNAINSAGASANSAEDSATPFIPMVNVAFGGTASSSMIGGRSWEQPSAAFDRNSAWVWANANGTNPGPTGWLRYNFGAGNAQTVKRYTVISADQADRDPKSWTFQGSNDGSTWTTLDTQSNQVFATRTHANVYNISNTTAYRYYQIDVTANNGGTSLEIAELGLWSDQGRTIPDGTYRVISKKSKKSLTALNGGTANGTTLVQWSWGGGNEQKWTLNNQSNGQYKATGVASGRVIDVSAGSTANGAKIQLWDWWNPNNQKWTAIPVGDGSFKVTAVHSGKVADVNGASTADGATVIQWQYTGGDNQKWLPMMISGAPASPILLGHWKFDEASGATAADSENGKTGTLVNGPVWTSGRLGYAVDLDGVNDYVSLPPGVVAGLTDFTISAWVKLDGTSSNTRIFDFGSDTSKYMELCPKSGSTGFMRFEAVTGGAVERIDTTYTFPAGTWTHVALTLSGSTGTLYVNGTAVGSNAVMSINPSRLGLDTTQNYIGKSQWSNDPYLNGSVDDFRVYNHALSAAAIATLATP